MLPALLIVSLLFAVLFLTRIGGAYRMILARRWPIILLAGAAILALLRGALWPGIVLAMLSIVAWFAWPTIENLLRTPPPLQPNDSPEDSAARALLGVGQQAAPDEIRRAYRAKMARAHPDRGGSHNEAARLTAARDRLLKKAR